MLHVAVLAQVLGVHGFFRAADSRLGSALFMVAVLAHAPRIVLPVNVLATCNDFLLAERRFGLVLVFDLLLLRTSSTLADDHQLLRLVIHEHRLDARVL